MAIQLSYNWEIRIKWPDYFYTGNINILQFYSLYSIRENWLLLIVIPIVLCFSSWNFVQISLIVYGFSLTTNDTYIISLSFFGL